MSDKYILSGTDLSNIAKLSGLTEDKLPDAFVDAFETRLKLQHRHGVAGEMHYSLLIPLLIEFGMTGGGDKKAADRVNWASIPDNSPIFFKHNGHRKREGYFKGLAAEGRAQVVPRKGKKDVIEVPVTVLSLRREREVVEREAVPAREAPAVKWSRISCNTPIEHKGHRGILRGMVHHAEQGQPEELTIEIDGDTMNVPSAEVALYVRKAE